ncbi:MAG: insulinase family protein [Cellulosilyticaceae bacterium]
MELNSIKGYTLETSEYIKEIDGTAYIYTHDQTKAKVLYIANDDPHKSFGIGFRTPPHDSTGVPHIIEHSVLCGSRKFPLKDPFVELAKGSLNTYLNAMTYPDKTLYPISSQNDTDFHNLMDVYLDAVFFPNIYKSKHILMQEGWRYHLEDEADALEYKGVVYNEMKGAFSSPEEVIFRKIKEILFPDTTYANESGGSPEFIPDLSYEDFIGFHKKYYQPSNSYICLYGELDIAKELDFIDKEYLSHFEYQKVDSEINKQQAFDKPVEKSFPYSVSEEKENQLYLSYNFVIGEITDPKLMLSMSILEYLLLDTPASPLKKALIKEGIGEDVFGVFQTHMRQPIFSIIAKNVSPAKKERFYELIDTTLAQIVKQGVPSELLNGALQVKEFGLREGDSRGYSKGLFYFIGCMKTWLYDADPTMYLKYEESLEEMNSLKTSGYFEEVIQKYLLDNKHIAKVELYPQVGLDTQMEEKVTRKLSETKASWTSEEVQAHIEETKTFNAYQNQEDTEEAIQSIPILTKDQLEKEPMFPRFELREDKANKYIVTPIFTNKITYMSWFIDLVGIEDKYMPYLGMLVGMLGKINTKNYSYEALSTYVDENIGGIEYHIQALHNLNHENQSRRMFIVKSKALTDKLDAQLEIMHEVICQTQIEDKVRLLEIIREMKSIMEMGLSGDGHKVASGRVLSHIKHTQRYVEETKGLTFYHFVLDIEKNWEARQDEILENLQNAYAYLNNRLRYTVGLIVDEEAATYSTEKIQAALEQMPEVIVEPLVSGFKQSSIQEGLVYPGNVNYVAMGYNFKADGYAYSGSMQMLKSILSMDYLWTKVRVKNGAYGCFADFRKSGNMFFTSYRDPNVKETLEAYRGVPEYVAQINLSERQLVQYLIGTISGLDFPYTPYTEGSAAQMYYFVDVDKEELQKSRDELFNTTNETLREFAPMIQKGLEKNQYCIFGNTTSIEDNKDLFTQITRV